MSDDSDYESGSDQEEAGGMSIADAYRVYAEEHDGQYPLTQKQFLSFINVGRGNGRWQLKFADVRSYWDQRDPIATSRPKHLDVVNQGMYGDEEPSDSPAPPQKRMSARDLSNEAYLAVATEASLQEDGGSRAVSDDDEDDDDQPAAPASNGYGDDDEDDEPDEDEDEYDEDEDDDEEPAQPAQPADDPDEDEDDEDEDDEDDEDEPEPAPAEPAADYDDEDEDDDDDEDDEDDDEDEDSD